jgi:hypothetical protein
MIREMMLFHVRGVEEPARQLERAVGLARFVADAQQEPDVYGQLVRAELDRFLRADANFLLHDTLEEHNLPSWFHEFAEAAGRHGLAYLAEADFHEMIDWAFRPEVSRALGRLAGDRIAREQYLDFLKCRMFRQTLLCHEGVPLDLSLRPGLARLFHVASPARPESREVDLAAGVKLRFHHPYGASIATEWPVAKAALLLLGERWPRALPFPEHVDLAVAGAPEGAAGTPRDRVEVELAQLLLRGYASGLVELHLHGTGAAPTPGERPVSSPLTRFELGTGRRHVTGTYHLTLPVEDEATAQLLLLADGTRGRDSLLDEVLVALRARGEEPAADGEPAHPPVPPRERLAESFERTLARLARLGLLVG